MHLKHTHRNFRQEYSCDPALLARLADTRGLWYETEDGMRAGLEASGEKVLLLHWVRREMRRRLSPRERRFLELHYFDGVATAKVARDAGVHRTTVTRTLQQAIHKLRRAARENDGGTSEDKAVIRAIKNRSW